MQPTSTPQPHSGRPVVRGTAYGRVLILCAAGHIVQSVKAADWPGSQLKARCSDPTYTVTCFGSTAPAAPGGTAD